MIHPINKRSLAYLFLALTLVTCRVRKPSDTLQQRSQTDSLSLWQWDELVILHERRDSLRPEVYERSSIHYKRKLRQEQRHHADSIKRIVNPPPKPKKLWAKWQVYVGLGVILSLAVVYGIYRIKRLLHNTALASLFSTFGLGRLQE